MTHTHHSSPASSVASTSDGHDETHFLAPLEEIVAAGVTDAERMLKAYNSVWAGSVDPIFLEYAY